MNGRETGYEKNNIGIFKESLNKSDIFNINANNRK